MNKKNSLAQLDTQTPIYVTPSLYSAWHYWDEATEDYKDKALNEFLCVLNKTKNPPTQAMQKGLDYEQKIQAMSERVRLGIPYNENDTTPDVDKQIADLLQDCIWQMPVSKSITLYDEAQVLLNGRVDAFDPVTDTIYDLKFTSRTFSQGMYESSIQHLVYMYCLNVPRFRYIVRNKSNAFLTDDYFHLQTTQLLKERLGNFLFSINTNSMFKEMFFNKWKIDVF